MADDPASGINVTIEGADNSTRVDPVTGTVEVDTPDGGVKVILDPPKESDPDATDLDKFFENLVDKLEHTSLTKIANDLNEAVQADDRSRAGKLADISRGLDLLGIKLAEPRSDVSDSSGPLDGMSSVTNPLLLEACLKGWANSQAELLPAEGPCKVQNVGDESEVRGELADAFEDGMNNYLTVGAPEYYPDTSSMLLWGTYFGGVGFKKVMRCPLRRRPVSDTVDVKDLIVSDTSKDFRACERITHQTTMRQSVMKRMKLIGEYADVALQPPTVQPNQVDEKIAAIQGTMTKHDRPEDEPYTIWETQCELDLEQFAPAPFKRKNIPLPYRVTMDKESREILSLRRDWNPDDDQCMRKRLYVKYPYIPGPGFYGTGLLNVLGNCTAAMTASWRLALDAGMFANFPAGLIAKLGGRQLTSDMRLSPASLKAIETNGMPISQIVMPLPYKDVTPGLLALMDKVLGQAKELGGTADIPAGEGLANVPVGTMLANIEQATKVMSAAHKGMHQAQGEELQMIADLFREDPEAFWRNNKKCPKDYWNEQKLIQALDTCTLIPKSDPNVPSHIHRVMKAVALVQLIGIPQFTPLMNATETLKRCLRALKEDVLGLLVPPAPQAGAPDLAGQAKMISAQAQAAKVQQTAQSDALKAQSGEKIASLNLAKEMVIHKNDQAGANADRALATSKHALDIQQAGHDHANANAELALKSSSHGLDVAQAQHDAQMDIHGALNPPTPGVGG